MRIVVMMGWRRGIRRGRSGFSGFGRMGEWAVPWLLFESTSVFIFSAGG